MSKLQVYLKFREVLLNYLPMNDESFITQLCSNITLSDDLRKSLQSQNSRTRKAETFLDYAEKRSRDNNEVTIFETLVKVMEESDNVVLEHLAKQINGELHNEPLSLDIYGGKSYIWW